MTEAEEASIDKKVEELLKIGRRVQIVLDTKTVAVVVLLLIGAVFLFLGRQEAAQAKKDARLAYLQSVTNDRDNLEGRKVFLQTRDCPVEYFRDLVKASQEHQDVASVQSPCASSSSDLDEVQRNLDAVNQKLAALQK